MLKNNFYEINDVAITEFMNPVELEKENLNNEIN